MKKKILLSVLCICMVLVMMPTMVFAAGEPPVAPPTTPTENGATDPAPPANTEVVAPSFGFVQSTVYKTSATQASITVNLNDSYTDATWKIYDDNTSAGQTNGISGTNNGKVLTLTNATDVPVGKYHISMVINEQESPRVELTIAWADATVSVENGMTEYVLEWGDMNPPVNLVMHNSWTVSGISYKTDFNGSETTIAPGNYTISPDGTTVTFTNAQIKGFLT
ncbi:MAG: hypothetical protein RR973_08050, partial [Anaerovoracaceae bacterium]